MSESLVNKLNRNQYLNDADIAFLLTELQGFREKTSDIVESTNFIPFADETRLRGESHTIIQHLTGTTPKLETLLKQCTRIDTTMIRKISAVPKSYPLIHSVVGNSFTYVKTPDSKFGAGIIFDGTNYITINHHTGRMNVNLKLHAIRLYLPATESGDLLQRIFSKGIAYNLHVRAHSDAPNTIRFQSDHAGNTLNFDYVYTPNTWFDVVIKDRSTSQEMWVDKISVATDSKSSGTNTNSEAFAIGARATGADKVKAGTTIAWYSWLNFTAVQSWVDDYFAGILDTDGKSEITTIPFIESENPQPEASFAITAF